MNLKITLKNIGKIDYADIVIDGITVIAGDNNSGKSMVGKILFDLYHCYFNYKDELYAYQDIIEDILEEIYVKLHDSNVSDDIYTEFINTKYYFTIDKLIKFSKKIAKIINDDDLFYLINKISDKKFKFDAEYINNNSQINVVEYNNIFEIKNNKTLTHNDTGLKDVTYLKPDIFNHINLYHTLILIKNKLKYKIPVKNIYADMTRKFRLENLNNYCNKCKEIINEIEQIIGGHIIVTDFSIKFIEKNKAIDIINTSDGIKTFAMIYLLLKNGWLYNFKHLIIFDKPETNLHPKWQIKFAEILVKLYKILGCPILINSHSPYIIDAIKHFGNKNGIISNIHFYLTSNSKIELADDKLDLIFNDFVTPLDNL